MTIAQQLKITTFPFEIKDENGNTIYSEFSNRYWVKSEYDQDGNEIYAEDSYGDITDNRPKPEPELTAVEWLIKQLNEKIDFIPMRKWDEIRDMVQQAKAMEKKQIIDARQDGVDVVFKGYSISNEEYYNETYGGDK
jgi:hypothetical protein